MIDALSAQFEWSYDDCVDPDEATVGRLRLFVDGAQVWGKTLGVDWVWRDLLFHLAYNWSTLLYEDWIEPVGDRRIAEAQHEFQTGLELLKRCGDLDPADAIERETLLYQWEQNHNLARSLPGLIVPDLHVWAAPTGIMVESPHGRREFARPEVDATLSRIGDEIANRLVSQGFEDDEAVQLWKERFPASTDDLAAGATGFNATTLSAARASFTEIDAWGDASGRMTSTSWLEVARSCHPFGSGALKAFFTAIGSPVASSERWERFADSLLFKLGTTIGDGQIAFDAAISRLARDLAGLGTGDPLRLAELTYHLGIELKDADLESTKLAAIVVFGLEHAPVVVTNNRACGLSREPLRRMAVASAVSWLADAALEGRPAAWAMPTDRLDAAEDRRALRLILPVGALEDYAAANNSPGLLNRIADHFGVPPRIAAIVLKESVLWSRISPEDQHDAVAHIEGRSLLHPSKPNLRLVR